MDWDKWERSRRVKNQKNTDEMSFRIPAPIVLMFRPGRLIITFAYEHFCDQFGQQLIEVPTLPVERRRTALQRPCRTDWPKRQPYYPQIR
jgi:hypothetical protein